MSDIDIIIEDYVNNFRNLLIVLFKGKNKIHVDNEKNIYNYCLHLNYKGKECKRRVKHKGDLCVFHKKSINKITNDFCDLSNKTKNNGDDYKEKKECSSFINKNKHLSNENSYPLDNLSNSSNNSLGKNEMKISKNDEYNKLKNINNNFNTLINEKEHNLLKIINTENNKLICSICKGTLTTQKDISNNICRNCIHFPPLNRNKTIIKCRTCNNNTLNINNICNNCLDNKKEYLKYCLRCKINKVHINQHICNYCHKKQKRKMKIF